MEYEGSRVVLSPLDRLRIVGDPPFSTGLGECNRLLTTMYFQKYRLFRNLGPRTVTPRLVTFLSTTSQSNIYFSSFFLSSPSLSNLFLSEQSVLLFPRRDGAPNCNPHRNDGADEAGGNGGPRVGLSPEDKLGSVGGSP